MHVQERKTGSGFVRRGGGALVLLALAGVLAGLLVGGGREDFLLGSPAYAQGNNAGNNTGDDADDTAPSLVSTPSTLPSLLRQGLTHNAELAFARAQLAEAQANLERARRAYFPTLSVTARYAGVDRTTETTGGTGGNNGDDTGNPDVETEETLRETDATLTLRQDLWSGGGVLAQHRAAYQGFQAARWQFESRKNQLARNIVIAYYDVIRYQGLVRLSLNQLNQLYELRQALVRKIASDPGIRTRKNRADNRVALAEEEVANNRLALVTARARLETLAGPLPGRLEVPEPLSEAQNPTQTFDEVRVAVLRNHPDIRAARARERQGSYEVDVARAAYAPTLFLDATREFNDETDPDFPMNDQTVTEDSIGLNLTWNLRPGGTVGANKRAARARLRAAEQQTLQIERLTLERLGNAWETYQGFVVRFQALERFLMANLNELAAARRENQAGQRSLVELMNLYYEVYLGRVRVLQAQLDRDRASYLLFAARGELLAITGVEE